MSKSILKALPEPDTAIDPLHELIRNGARQLIASAVDAELNVMLSQYAEYRLDDGRLAVVRNGYLPSRTIQTGIGDVEIKVPKVRDRSGSGIYAREMAEDNGLLNEVPEPLRSYFDFEAWARDLFSSGYVFHKGYVFSN